MCKYFLTLIIFFVFSCGKSKENKVEEVDEIHPVNIDGNIIDWIREQKECADTMCEISTMDWTPQTYDWNDTEPTFMVIDIDPFDILIYGKYAKRTKDILIQKPDGTYDSTTLSKINVTNGFKSFIRNRIGSYSSYIPAPDLHEQGEEILNTYAEDFNAVSKSSENHVLHGISTLGFIGEHNPRSSIVVASFPKIPDDYFIGKEFEALTEYSEIAGKSLASKITTHGVDVISMSAGHDRRALRLTLTSRFPGIKYSYDDETKFLKALLPFYEALSNIEGVLFVQAGGLFGKIEDANEESSPVDCASNTMLPNRLEISYFTSPNQTNIPSDGGSFDDFYELIEQQSLLNGLDCYDAYFNLGNYFTESRGETSFHVTNYGIQWFPFPTPGSSYSAPIATSYFLYKFRHDNWSSWSVSDVIEYMRIEGSAGLFDPLEHYHTNYFFNRSKLK